MVDTLVTDLATIAQATAAHASEHQALYTFVQLEVPLSDRQLQSLIGETTEQVWQHIDCRTCANCCRLRHPVFRRPEVERMAAHLGLTVADVYSRYLTSDADTGKYITRTLPCPFLDGNLCTIYPVRPAVCANYPHLHRNLRARFWQTLDNAAVCPIIYNVLERLKTCLGFVRAP